MDLSHVTDEFWQSRTSLIRVIRFIREKRKLGKFDHIIVLRVIRGYDVSPDLMDSTSESNLTIYVKRV